MENIKEIVVKNHHSFEELIFCFEEIRANGDIAVIKFDGKRQDNWYTVFVSFPDNKRSMIRSDESDLKKALLNVLIKYVEIGE